MQPLFRPHRGPEGPTGELGRCCPRLWPQEVTVPTPVHRVATVDQGLSAAWVGARLPAVTSSLVFLVRARHQGRAAQSGRKMKAPLETFLDLKTCVFRHSFIPQIFTEHFMGDSSEHTPGRMGEAKKERRKISGIYSMSGGNKSGDGNRPTFKEVSCKP